MEMKAIIAPLMGAIKPGAQVGDCVRLTLDCYIKSDKMEELMNFREKTLDITIEEEE